MAAPIATRLILNTSNFTKGMKASTKLLAGFGGAVAKTGIGLAKFGALMATIAGGAMTAIILRQTAFTARLVDTSTKLGVNIQFLQKFRYAAEQSGVSVETADMALQRFTRRAAEAARGTGEALGAFRKLGIQIKDTNGNLRPMEEILFDVADGIANTTDESERVRLAFKFFDSEGVSLVNTLREGGDALREMFTAAEALGFILTREAAVGVKEFDNALLDLRKLLGGITAQITAALAPALEQLTEQLIEFLQKLAGEAGGFENLGKILKDKLLDVFVVLVQAMEKTVNIVIALTNAIIGMARAVGVSGLPELSEQGQQAAKDLEALRDSVNTPLGFISIDTDQVLTELANLGYNVDEFREKFDNLGLFDSEARRELRADIEAYINDLISTLEAKATTFDQVDFGNIIDILLGNKEEAIAKAEEVTDGIEEVLVTAQPRFTKAVAFLDKIFGEDLVNRWLDSMDEMEAAGVDMSKTFSETFMIELEKTLAMLEEVGERVKERLGTPLQRLTKTLEDGLVKGVEIFEDTLTDAILTGKADFTDLANHIKKVLAKALVQKFITGPIMGLFGLADGGPAKAGRPYIVGEEGPELFVPNQSGTVIPNDEMTSEGRGLGGSTTVNYNINAIDSRSFQQRLAENPEYLFNITQVGARRQPA